MSTVRLELGDCLDVLKTLDESSVDSIVTDPPYELGFMGKGWDSTGIAYNVDLWRECLRVLKPGGHLLAFSGTRTYHRMASAIEDAGFEIRDMIAWVYGQGFPKSLNIGKAVDKINGEAGRQLKFTTWMRTTGLKSSEIDSITGTNMGGHYLTTASQPAIPTAELWGKLRPHIKAEIPQWVDELVERIEREREVVGTRKVPSGHSFAGEQYGESEDIDYNDTKGTSEWEGWGTALKPAHEPIVLARKPLSEKSVAENVLKHGTGGLNIDGSRVEGIPPSVPQPKLGVKKAEIYNFATGEGRNGEMSQATGRFPANLIHDGSDEVKECFPESKTQRIEKPCPEPEIAGHKWGTMQGNRGARGYDGEGNASRFFKSIVYTAKASKKDRNDGCDKLNDNLGGSLEGGNDKRNGDKPQLRLTKNHHPTVKPTDLMRYLCRMVTPPGGTVLDPFMGSGSTGKAAALEGFSFIGIEREPEYMEIARARINAVPYALL